MEYHVEKEIILPHVSVQLATVNWKDAVETPPYSGYTLSQRLSENHSPLRIGNLATGDVMPRVRSVGFLPPGCSVRMLPVESTLRVIYCFFDADFFERTTGIAQAQWNQQLEALISIKNQRLEILMQEIYAELLQPDFGSETLIDAASKMLAIELARYARKLQRKKSRQGDSLALAPWQLRRVQERIAASLERGYPNLSELAELCGVSQGHLMRAFKAATGWQIHKYITEERLKTAKDLLLQDEFSCEEVSERLGFKSPAYFSTAFRRMTGKTPTEFRRQMRKPSE